MGLCLYPDRWGYAWSTDDGPVVLGDEPRLPCRVKGPAPLPERLPEVAWRGGIDLNPLDVADADAMAWLETLVWPEQDDRRARLEYDALVRRLVADGACHWVSNEAKQVLPSVTATGPPTPADHPTFVLGIDGRMVAQTHGHGRSLRWVG